MEYIISTNCAFSIVKWKGDHHVNRRICPECGGRSYSSCSGTDWDCPYCGRDLGHLRNELCDSMEDSQEEETSDVVGIGYVHT